MQREKLDRRYASTLCAIPITKFPQDCDGKDSPEGDNFRILGVLFDGKLTMVAAVKEMANEARWRLRVLERSGTYFDVPQLVLKYKARVLSYLEYRTAAVYHAADSVLETVDKVQRGFVKRLGLTEVDALVEFRLTPLSCRRDMAIFFL